MLSSAAGQVSNNNNSGGNTQGCVSMDVDNVPAAHQSRPAARVPAGLSG